MRDRLDIGGVMFDNVDMRQALDIVEARVVAREASSPDESSLLLVANQDIFNHVGKYKNLSFADLNKSFLVIPDGFSIVYGAKYLGTPIKERVTGPDLMENFMRISNEKGYRHFFLGAADGVAERMRDNFLVRYPNLQVAGLYSPPFGEFSVEENQKMVDMVNASNSDVLWVSFGCPKQEWWIIENVAKLTTPVVAGVGAAFDFHSGNKRRAPVWIQRLRLEWFYRLCQEPGRLWNRYIDGAKGYFRILHTQKKRMKNK